MGKYNRNNKAFQSNANRPFADSRSTIKIANKFEHVGEEGWSDPCTEGAGPCREERGQQSQVRSKLNKSEYVQEAGSLYRRWQCLVKGKGAKPCTWEGRPGPCTGTSYGETDTQTHTTSNITFATPLAGGSNQFQSSYL